ncbi:MAG: TlyA family RNA methyltransferase, partial [Candidatus Limnocylindria bacterium]
MPGSGPGARIRADQLVVDRGLARSRAEAQALILAGAIRIKGAEGRRLSAGQRLEPSTALLRDDGPAWASRGGEKLAAALDAFRVPVDGLACLDAGASTGGFTDVLLARGARRVYAVDVGHGQLLPRLAQDPRVEVLDRTNLRTLASLPEAVDLATLDLSFISLRLVLEPVRRLLSPRGRVVALVKP